MGAAASHEPLDKPRLPDKGLTRSDSRLPRRMDRLRRSLRDSLRRKRDSIPEASKPHQWQADEVSVKAGTCTFHVKYIGCTEVYESRGMHVCEEALKVLRNSRRRPVKAILYVSGDGLRVVEDETKGLIVDQTIEKVSFCAPDRNHEKGFSYICRDGTTRRWMCHGFLATKDSVSGERLSHAVGCAFAACLERKQKRDKECGVSLTYDPQNQTFTRSGSYRQASITDRLHDPPELKSPHIHTGIVLPISSTQIPTTPQNDGQKLHFQPEFTKQASTMPLNDPPSTTKAVDNPFAIERPHAPPTMLQRQGSFRAFSQLSSNSPFKRQLSLRLSDLPSTIERQRLGMVVAQSKLPTIPNSTIQNNKLCIISPPSSTTNGQLPVAAVTPLMHNIVTQNNQPEPASPQPPPRQVRGRLMSLPNASPQIHQHMSPIAESSPVNDPVSALCQQVSHGLNLLSSAGDPFNNGTCWDTPPTTPLSVQESPMGSSIHQSTSIQQSPMATISSNRQSPMTIQQNTIPVSAPLPKPEQWLASATASVAPLARSHPHPPPLGHHLRSQSLGADPFDAEWASLPQRRTQPEVGGVTNSNNPFGGGLKAFEVQL